MLAQAHEQALLAIAIAKRARGLELRERDLLDDAQALGDQRDDLTIDGVDAIAQQRQVHGHPENGKLRNRTPVSANHAFAIAGATGGTPGSPAPPG